MINESTPLTIRQLHAMIRLSTAFAKLKLSKKVNEEHVDLAWDLYKEALETYQFKEEKNALDKYSEEKVI